jgi:hypothetical protein
MPGKKQKNNSIKELLKEKNNELRDIRKENPWIVAVLKLVRNHP